MRRGWWIAFVLLAAPVRAADVARLSLADFTKRAEDRSLRSRISQDSLSSSRWGWTATRRSLTWPSLTARANDTRTTSDDDLGTQTDVESRDGSLALEQPLLTGTRLSLASGWTHGDTDTDVFGAHTRSLTRDYPAWQASVNQPLFLFVRNPSLRTKREADLQWDSAQDSFRNEQLAIRFDARSLYYDVLLKDATLAVEKKKLESSELVQRTTNALVRAGKLANVELTRARIRAQRDRRRIANAESALQQAQNEAKDVILLPPSANLILTTPLRYDPMKLTLDELWEAARANNPSLLNRKRDVRLSELSLQRTREGDRPQLNAEGTYTQTLDRADAAHPREPDSWSTRLSLQWPIFDATQTRLRSLQAQVALTNATRTLENDERQLRVSLENAYLELKRTEDQILEFGVERETAQANLRAIRLQYENGLTRLSDVFDSENELRDLELEYLGLLVNFNVSRDRVGRLVGKDLAELRPKR
jgi:outer membrane protein TolC